MSFTGASGRLPTATAAVTTAAPQWPSGRRGRINRRARLTSLPLCFARNASAFFTKIRNKWFAYFLLPDTGYFSNVSACNQAGIDPRIAAGRQPHYPSLQQRFEPAPPAPKDSTPVQTRAHRLQTPEGRALYALRKQTQEPVFSIIKSILGFRQFSLRGLEKVRGKLEPRDHGLEYQAFVRARSHPRLTGPAGLGNADTAIKAHRLCQVVARPRLKPAPPTEAVILVLQCDEIRLSITLCCPRWPKTQTIGAVKPCRGCLRLLLAA